MSWESNPVEPAGLAGRLRQRMEDLAWSINRLATKSGVPRRTIQRIRAGTLKRGPYLDTLERLAEPLGVSAAWLGFGEE